MGLRQTATEAKADPFAQFKILRERAAQQQQSFQQQNIEAAQRKLASQGLGSSGQAIKIERQIRDESQRQGSAAQREIDLGEAQEAARLGEVQRERQFQSAEAEKGRGFQREMTEKQMGFQEKVFAFDSQTKLKQLEFAEREFKTERQDQERNLLT